MGENPNVSVPSEETKERLIETTIRLVAAHGVKGVSVRTLTSEAGCKNLTAIHYHFGGKRQLVDAALRCIFDRIIAVGEPALADLEARIANGAAVTPREVLQAWIVPAATLSAAPGIGPLSMRFVAQVLTNAADEVSTDFLHTFVPILGRMLAMLHHAIPHVPAEVLIPRIVVLTNSVVHTLSELAGINKARESYSVEIDPLDALHEFIAYHAAGLSAPASKAPESLGISVAGHVAAWQQILKAKEIRSARKKKGA